MRKLFLIATMAIATLCIPTTVSAQGLGGLLKKGKKVLEKVTQTETPTPNSNGTGSGSSINLANGIEMTNPMAEYMDVTPIGLYGVPTSENYGNVYLVLKVTMKEPANKANFGGVGNDRMVAVDANGKVYNGATGSLPFETPEGIPVQIVMNQPQLMFEGVKKDTKVMPVVKFGILIDAYHKGNLTLKNVPVYWDENPE